MEAVQSVQAQTYQQWELLAVDDGSTDDTVELLRALSDQDARIRFFSIQHKGSAAARNTAIKHAKGRYIALLDADDVWNPSFLAKQIDFLNRKKAICVCSAYGFIDENSTQILHKVHCRDQISVHDMMVANRVGCLTGLYDSMKYGKMYLDESLGSLRDDYAYYIQLVKLEGVIYGNPEALAWHRVRKGSATRQKLKQIPVHYRFNRKYLGFSRFRSILNTGVWGIQGFMKYCPRLTKGKTIIDE